jgi:hypothetical protein
MGLHAQDAQTSARFLTVTAGKLREKVEEGTEGATLREGTLSNGETFSKWELVYPGITAFITSVELQDGKYGKNVLVHMTDANDESFTVSLGAENSRTGVPFMMALPNLDLTKEVTIKPYKFNNDKGENVEGIKIMQGETAIKSAFYDPETKSNLRGMPAPKSKKDGSINWKLYFAERDEWLQEYMVENGFITVGEPYVPATEDVESPADNGEDF